MIQIKICGVTSVEQAQACVDLGATWIGLNCYEGSSRYVSPEQIQKIVVALPQRITTVGVFVNESSCKLQEIMQQTGLSLAQLHGDETSSYAQELEFPFMKAFRVQEGVQEEFQQKQISDFHANLKESPQNPFFLLDSWCHNYGGSGKIFNWEVAQAATQCGKLFLAGGLTPHNVAQAILQVRPYGVDVCSSVEQSPGVKDLELVKEFIQQIYSETKFT